MRRSSLSVLSCVVVLLLLVWLTPAEVDPDGEFVGAPGCTPHGDYEAVTWRHVHDGDTLVLEDGRRVRVIGLNAPEVSRKGPGEPLGDAATAAARNFLRHSKTLWLQEGSDSRDRYGRVLAYVFRPGDGASLTAQLLGQGLAWHIAVPPNLNYLDCFASAEVEARAAALGVWSQEFTSSRDSRRLQGGFRVLRARIDEIKFGKSWWLETDAGFVLQVAARDQGEFQRGQVSRWQGKMVEVRGWMYERKGSSAASRGHDPWVLTLRHPSALRVLSGDAAAR